jgi:hypothetical protein
VAEGRDCLRAGGGFGLWWDLRRQNRVLAGVEAHLDARPGLG